MNSNLKSGKSIKTLFLALRLVVFTRYNAYADLMTNELVTENLNLPDAQAEE